MASRAGGDQPDFQGYLTKRSRWLKEWRKRFFVLRGNQLHFMENADAAPHGTIDLSNCLTVKSAEEKTRKKHCFEVQTPEAV